MIKQTILMSTIVAVFVISAFSGNAYSQIAMGVAYKPISSCKTFNQAAGYAYEYGEGRSLAALRSTVQERLEDSYGSDVIIYTSSKSHLYIYGYKYWIDSYRCWKSGYAYGFGDDYSEAEQNAEKQAKQYCSLGKDCETWYEDKVRVD